MKTIFIVLLPSILLFALPAGYGQKGRNLQKVPEEIKTPSHVGEINFPHRAHTDEYDVKCENCHHSIKAPILKIPHRFRSRDNWNDCTYCHNPKKPAKKRYSCRKCHDKLNKNYMKQVLSFKEAIHKSCEECHEMGNGVEASKSCRFCHTGPKMDYKTINQ